MVNVLDAFECLRHCSVHDWPSCGDMGLRGRDVSHVAKLAQNKEIFLSFVSLLRRA
jgi:hypothetical protein